MYLGFFFIHWSSTKLYRIWQSEPIQTECCPFCNVASTIVYKIYNKKTRHYNLFSIGGGDFTTAVICRNCVTEVELSEKEGDGLIEWYHTERAYAKAVDIYDKKPGKAIKKLKKVVKRGMKHKLDCSKYVKTLNQWEGRESVMADGQTVEKKPLFPVDDEILNKHKDDKAGDGLGGIRSKRP